MNFCTLRMLPRQISVDIMNHDLWLMHWLDIDSANCMLYNAHVITHIDPEILYLVLRSNVACIIRLLDNTTVGNRNFKKRLYHFSQIILELYLTNCKNTAQIQCIPLILGHLNIWTLK